MLYEKLNYVIAVAEEQNLTLAAKRLFISQPALTLYLNRLESELGVKLFNRGKSPVTLTDAGVYYLEKMKQIYSAEQELRNDIRFIDSPSQTLLVGIGQVRGHLWLPEILPEFCATHPEVNIRLCQGAEQTMFEDLKKYQLDIVIGALPFSKELETIDIVQEPVVFAAHKRFGLVPESERKNCSALSPAVIDPKLLNGLPFIIPQTSNGLYSCYEEILQHNKFHPSRTISLNNLNTGLMLTISGLGVQLLSASLLLFSREPGVKNLDFFQLKDMPKTRRCVAAFQKGGIKNYLVRDFVRIVQEKIADMEGNVSG